MANKMYNQKLACYTTAVTTVFLPLRYHVEIKPSSARALKSAVELSRNCVFHLLTSLVEWSYIYVERVLMCQSISFLQAGSKAVGQMAGRAQPPCFLQITTW